VKENPDEMFETLEEAHGRLRELRKQRDKLMEANKKLAKALVSMEDNLERSNIEMESLSHHSYSFHKGWQSHQDELAIGDISEDSVDQQLKQLNKLLSDEEIL
jgi:chromosome segregation ATPase